MDTSGSDPNTVSGPPNLQPVGQGGGSVGGGQTNVSAQISSDPANSGTSQMSVGQQTTDPVAQVLQTSSQNRQGTNQVRPQSSQIPQELNQTSQVQGQVFQAGQSDAVQDQGQADQPKMRTGQIQQQDEQLPDSQTQTSAQVDTDVGQALDQQVETQEGGNQAVQPSNQTQDPQTLTQDTSGQAGQPSGQIPADQVQPQVGQVLPSEPQVGRSFDSAQGKPAGAKEVEFVSGVDQGQVEVIPIVEVEEQGELSPEVEGWVERAEHDQVPEPKTIVHKGQVYASPSSSQQVQVTLPLDQVQIKQGIHHKVFDSVRWLAEWCLRLVRKYKGEVGYKETEDKNPELRIKN